MLERPATQVNAKARNLEPNPKILTKLREVFLDAKKDSRGVEDYWLSDPDVLAQYDAFLGPRIEAKWAAVLSEMQGMGWRLPEPATVVDWGCGTGAASRSFFRVFEPKNPGQVEVDLRDRSPAAVQFAVVRHRQLFPKVGIGELANSRGPSILLVSHVLNELPVAWPKEFVQLVERAETIVWIEPGTPFHSEMLVRFREKQRGKFAMLAPCPHQGPCGLASGEFAHWCHQFAPPPQEFFRERKWAIVQRLLHLDLRSLPLSYLVMVRPGSSSLAEMNSVSGDRVLGAVRFQKREMRASVCQPSGVIAEVSAPSNKQIEKRAGRGEFSPRWPLV